MQVINKLSTSYQQVLQSYQQVINKFFTKLSTSYQQVLQSYQQVINKIRGNTKLKHRTLIP